MQSTRLFVYGSLKRGFRHHGEMRGAVYKGAVVTAPGYLLYVVGEYPALVASGYGVVSGELYEVIRDHLLRLDVFEGHPERYERKPILLADGTRAMAYTMRPELVDGLDALSGGEWCETEMVAQTSVSAD